MTELEKMTDLEKMSEKLMALIKSNEQWLANRKLTNNNKLLLIITEFEKIGINPVKYDTNILNFVVSDELSIIISIINKKCVIDLFYYDLHVSYHSSDIKIINLYDIMFLDIENLISIDLTNELNKGGKNE